MNDSTSPVLSDTSPHSDHYLKAAMIALRAGDVMQAAEVAEQARAIDQSPRVLIVFAAISHALGRDADALSMLEQAMRLAPDVGNYPDAAAAILLKLGRKSDGIFNLKLGTYLPSDPFLDEIIGDFFGKIKEIFDSFIENRPLATARLMIEQGLYSAAIRHLETFVGVSGGDAESFALIVDCALHLGLHKDAAVALNALEALRPDHPRIPDYALGLALLRGNAVEAAAASAKLKPVGELKAALDRFRLLELSPLVEAETLARALAALQALTVTHPDVDNFAATDLPAKPSVGFLCAEIDSALENMLLALSEYMSVRVYLLGTGNSPSQQRVKAALEDFREVASVDDATLIEMIRSDQVSVLFDAIGAGAFARPRLWRTRMAPVQILWALPSLYDNKDCYDYRLYSGIVKADAYAFDVGVPLRYPVPPAELMGRVAEARAMTITRETGERKTRRLIAPHSNAILTDQALETYMTLLAAVPDASLSFVAVSDLEDPLVQRVLAAASAQGCADRVELIAPMDFVTSRSEIMRDADLVLDSFPYGNIDMVQECLWIGCPVLTLKGDNPRSSAAAALMQTIGVEAFVTETVEAYLQTAIRLLKDDKTLISLKEMLQANQRSLSIMRYQVAAEALARKIESLWTAHHSRKD